MDLEKPTSQMAHISASSLRDLPYRISYLSSFLSFQPSDGLAIQASKPLIAPLIPVALDLVYSKLLGYDITAKAFTPRQGSDEGIPAPTRPQDLHLTHSHILHRKNFLRAYLVKIVSNTDWTPSSPLWRYMDVVGTVHTGSSLQQQQQQQRKGARKDLPPALRVEYMQLSLLLGFVQDVVVGLVLDMESIDAASKREVILAWNKLLWIQNDLFARHYVIDEDTGERPGGSEEKKTSNAATSGGGVRGWMLNVAVGVGYGVIFQISCYLGRRFF